MDGADFLIDVSASPGYGIPANGELMNAATVNNFLRTYAELMTTFVFYSNRVGVEDGIAFWGGSCVLGPDGAPVVTAPLFEETLLVTEISTDALRRARLKLPTLRDEQSELVRHEMGRIAKRELDR